MAFEIKMPDAQLPAYTLPPWCDPTWMLRAHEWKNTRIDFDDPGMIVQFNGNPRRWAIGFLPVTTSEFAIVVTPYPRDFFDPRGWRVFGVNYLWLTCFTHGPVVQSEFYMSNQDPTKLEIIEVLISG